MTIYGAKTFTMSIEVTREEEIFTSFVGAEKEVNKDIIRNFIEKDIQPLVPSKRVKKFGWTVTYKTARKIFVDVIFYLENEKYLGKF